MIKLINDTIDHSDIDKLIEWLQTYPRLTKGPRTLELEEKFAKYIGRKYAIFCNSGSSANLLMLATAKEEIQRHNNKIVIPAVAWATDLAPAIQLGFDVRLCDVNLENLSVDLEHLEHIFKEEKPAFLLLVSVLGLVPNMSEITRLCCKYGVLLLTDNCESLGSTFKGKELGTFGLMSTFSTFFGHHISTIEGGFVVTDDLPLYNTLLSLRSHGWDRDLNVETQKRLQGEWKVSEFNALYTFYHAGYNLRSTDLQAYIGLGQLGKLDSFVEKRANNFAIYQEQIKNDFWKPVESQEPGTITSNFAYPVIHPNRDKMVESLQNNNVEVRPLICGSMGTQPFYIKHTGAPCYLKNADIVDKYGFYVPNHPDLREKDIEFICKLINQEM